MGANVHALCTEEIRRAVDIWGLRQKDPFLVFLEGVVTEHIYHWNSVSLSDAVSQWGRILLDAGVDLLDYIAVENKFLQSIQFDDTDWAQRNFL